MGVRTPARTHAAGPKGRARPPSGEHTAGVPRRSVGDLSLLVLTPRGAPTDGGHASRRGGAGGAFGPIENSQAGILGEP